MYFYVRVTPRDLVLHVVKSLPVIFG